MHLHEFDEQFRAFDQRKAKLADQIQESESEKTRLEHELTLLETERTIPSETELNRLRTERDIGMATYLAIVIQRDLSRNRVCRAFWIRLLLEKLARSFRKLPHGDRCAGRRTTLAC